MTRRKRACCGGRRTIAIIIAIPIRKRTFTRRAVRIFLVARRLDPFATITTTRALRTIADFAKFPELRWLDNYHWVPPRSARRLCFLIGGWPLFVWGFFISTVLFARHVYDQLAVPSVRHAPL